MFERFTRDARAAVLDAQEEARELGHSEVGTEHFLLALANPDTSRGTAVLLNQAGATYAQIRDALVHLVGSPAKLVSDQDAEALSSIGIDLDAVVARIEESFGPGALTPKPGRVRFSKPAKVALQLALREAVRLKTGAIASETLLLGLLRAKGTTAARILGEIGIDMAGLRTRAEASLRPAA